jgi:predicted dehydrogenase
MANRGCDVTRLLVAGLGLIGGRHARMIEASALCDLVGVIDPDEGLRAGYDVPGFANIDAVDIAADGIVLATPTPLHADHAEAAAKNGWHIMIEKPVADSVEGVARIVAATTQAGVQTLVGHHRRHHKSVQVLKEIVASEIGQPVLANCLWAMRKPDAYFEGNWRDGAAGSPVMINMVHDIDLLRFVMGEVAHVTAIGSNPLRASNRVESGVISLAFASGALGSICFADNSPSPWGFEAATSENPNIGTTGQDFLVITGTEGAVSYPSLAVWSGSQDWGVPVIPKVHACATTIPLEAQLSHFVKVVEGRSVPVITAADAGETLRVALQAQAAIDAFGLRL